MCYFTALLNLSFYNIYASISNFIWWTNAHLYSLVVIFFCFRREILNHLLYESRYDARIAPNYEEGTYLRIMTLLPSIKPSIWIPLGSNFGVHNNFKIVSSRKCKCSCIRLNTITRQINAVYLIAKYWQFSVFHVQLYSLLL